MVDRANARSCPRHALSRSTPTVNIRRRVSGPRGCRHSRSGIPGGAGNDGAASRAGQPLRAVYVFNAERPLRYFAFVLSHLEPTAQTTVRFPAVPGAAGATTDPADGTLDVSVLANPGHRRGGRAAAERAAEIAQYYQSLLDDAPAMRDLIRTYPNGTDPHTQEFFYWVKEAFGFKPVVSLNHTRVHTDVSTGRVTIVTAQIYASHYIEGSLGINALMPDRESKDTAFYWAYVNRARVGRLGGLLGKIARPVVQHRARSGLMKSLVQTKQRFEAAGGVPLSK